MLERPRAGKMDFQNRYRDTLGRGGEFGSSGALRESREVRTAQGGLWVREKLAELCARARRIGLKLAN